MGFTNGYGHCSDGYGAEESHSEETVSPEVADDPELSDCWPSCASNQCGFYGCSADGACTTGGAATHCYQSTVRCVGPFTNGYGHCSDGYGAEESQSEEAVSSEVADDPELSDCWPSCASNQLAFMGAPRTAPARLVVQPHIAFKALSDVLVPSPMDMAIVMMAITPLSVLLRITLISWCDQAALVRIDSGRFCPALVWISSRRFR